MNAICNFDELTQRRQILGNPIGDDVIVDFLWTGNLDQFDLSLAPISDGRDPSVGTQLVAVTIDTLTNTGDEQDMCQERSIINSFRFQEFSFPVGEMTQELVGILLRWPSQTPHR
jgi:hypothetical protein